MTALQAAFLTLIMFLVVGTPVLALCEIALIVTHLAWQVPDSWVVVFLPLIIWLLLAALPALGWLQTKLSEYNAPRL